MVVSCIYLPSLLVLLSTVMFRSPVIDEVAVEMSNANKLVLSHNIRDSLSSLSYQSSLYPSISGKTDCFNSGTIMLSICNKNLSIMLSQYRREMAGGYVNIVFFFLSKGYPAVPVPWTAGPCCHRLHINYEDLVRQLPTPTRHSLRFHSYGS